MTDFDDLASIPPQQLWPGYRARAVHGERLTLAVVEIEPGAELPEHRHVNEQFGMVLQGELNFRVGEEERTGRSGRDLADRLRVAALGDRRPGGRSGRGRLLAAAGRLERDRG